MNEDQGYWNGYWTGTEMHKLADHTKFEQNQIINVYMQTNVQGIVMKSHMQPFLPGNVKWFCSSMKSHMQRFLSDTVK